MRIRSLVLLIALLAASPLHAAIRGTVMTFEGKPIASARVAAYAPETWASFRERLVSPKPERQPVVEATTDAKGAFSVDAGKSGSFDFVIEAAGYAPIESRAVADYDFGAIPLRAAALKEGRVTGNGKPVAGARVVWNGTAGLHFAVTDEEGRYKAPDPAAFPAFLMMWHPDYAVIAEEPMRRSTKRSLDVVATGGIVLRGRVVGSDRNTGVPGATISVDGWPLAKSAGDGSFEVPHAPARWNEITALTAGRSGVRTRGTDGPITIVMTTPAAVSGVITDSRTGKSLAGAEIVASAGRTNSYGDPAAFTDAKGAYRLSGIAPGAYTLSVRHPDYSGSPTAVTLRPGDRIARNLTVRPLAQVMGSVLDDEKRPVAAARIDFEMTGGRMGGFPTRIQAQYSAPDGRFVMHDMPVEVEVRLGAAKPGNPRATGDPMRLAPAEVKSGILLTIPRGLEVTGRVLDRDGRAVRGALVDFREQQQNPGMRFSISVGLGDDPAAIRSDSNGRFTVRVKEGKYDFAFRAPGFAPRRLPSVVVEPAMKPLEVTLDPGVEISGRVVRSDGSGVEGAAVNAFSLSAGSANATSAADGSFVLSDLAPGPMTVFAMTEGATQPVRQGVTAPARDIVLEIPRGGTIRGRVTDKESGNPVSDFQVIISEVRSGGGMLMAGPGTRKQFHTDDGTFVMEGVPLGPVDISVLAAGYSKKRVPGLRIEEAKPVVDVGIALETGGRLIGRVTGPDGSPVEGATVMRTSSESMPVPAGMRDEPRAQTDANGDYAFDSLEIGEHPYTFSKSGFLTDTRTVNVTGRETRLDVRLSRGLAITGTVTSAAGMPLSGVTITASSAAANSEWLRATTDAQGGFRMEGVAPGRYEIDAAKQGLASKTLRDVDVETAGHLRITLESGGVIYGTVRGLTPEELASTIVQTFSGDSRAFGTPDANGAFRIEGVAEGSARVGAAVRTGGGSKSSPTKNVDVAAGGETMVEIEFSGGTTIQGRVTRQGRAETNATISFAPASPTIQTRAMSMIDQNGTYSVSGLEDGSYDVRVINMTQLTPYSTKYEVRGSGTFDIDIRGATLRGRVVDSTTGDPIVEARITLQPVDVDGDAFMSAFNAVSDAAGEFVIELIAAGRYTARAQKASFGHQAIDIDINDAGSNVIEMKLQKEEGLTIRTLDARTGRELEAAVMVRDASNRVVFDTLWATSTDGVVRAPVSAGTYTVRVGSSGYANRVIQAQAPSREIRVALTPGGSLVIDSSRADRVAARILDARGADYTSNVAYRDTIPLNPGKTTFQNIAPGSYTLQVLGAGGQVEKSVPVTVREGQVTEIRI